MKQSYRLKTIYLVVWALFLSFQPSLASPKIDPNSCSFKGHNLYGKIQFVNSFPDLKVQIVNSFPDIKVQMVNSFPSKCGQWQAVNSFPDLKVQIVNSFPDIKVQYVNSFPGIK
ncbi:MAG: hypothetical protein MH321_10185 [Leptospiraceae bacterium]|nr:hypothetical protein [Leptospiraceae bacterium]